MRECTAEAARALCLRPTRPVQRLFWGEVHEAEQVAESGLVKKVRLWSISPELCVEEEPRRWLLEDLRRAGRLQTYAVTQILDIWEQDQRVSVVTEHLEGLSLRAALDEGCAGGSLLSIPAVLAVALEASRALEYAHDPHTAGGVLVHGDLRPEQVLLGYEGGVKLTGFGLVRFLPAVSAEGEWCSWSGRCYQPPGRIDGASARPVDDLYALGLVLLEALAAGPELGKVDPGELLARLSAGDLWMPDRELSLPGDLAQVIRRACASDGGVPYGSASELAQDLHLLLLERRVVRPSASLVRAALDLLEPPSERGRTASLATELDEDDLIMVSDFEVPFVGREDVLGAISGALASALSSRGQLVLLRGEPGMGRSRLIDEIARRLGAEPPERRPRWLRVSINPAEQSTRASTLLRVLGVATGLPAEVELAAVGQATDRLRAFGLDAEAIAAIRSVVGLTEPPAPPRAKRLIGEATLRCLAALSWERPTVVAIDDIQWADDASLEGLRELVDRLAELPLLVILSERSDFERPWALPEGAHVLELEPLRHDECEAMVVQMGWGQAVDPGLLERLCDHSASIPGRLEEVLGLLDEEQRLRVVDGQATLAGDPSAPLPRLFDAVRAQLEELDEAGREVLISAAAAGPLMTTALLSRSTGATEDQVALRLRSLADAGRLLRQRASGVAFRSERARKAVLGVAEDEALRRARRALARALLESSPRHAESLDDQVAELMHEAGDQAEAAALLRESAQRQAARGDLRGAAERFARALSLGRAAGSLERAEELELCLSTGRAAVHSLHLELGEWALHRAVELAERERDHRAGAEIQVLLCRLLARAGRLEAALDRARDAIGLAKRTGDDSLVAQACGAIAETYQQRGNFGQDLEYIERALELARAAGEPRALAEYLQLAVVHALGVGEYGHTREQLDQARAIIARDGDPLLTCQLHRTEGLLLRFSGDNEAALAKNLEGIALAHAHGLSELEIIMLHNCGDNHLALGRERQALLFYSESLRRSRAERFDRLTEANLMFVGFLEATHLGLESGFDQLREAITSAERHGRLWNLTQGHRLLGQSLLFLGNPESARFHLNEALKLAHQTGVRFFIEQAEQALLAAQG